MSERAAEHEVTVPKCDCSLSWRYRKGSGPDPAKCAVHGEPRTSPRPEAGA